MNALPGMDGYNLDYGSTCKLPPIGASPVQHALRLLNGLCDSSGRGAASERALITFRDISVRSEQFMEAIALVLHELRRPNFCTGIIPVNVTDFDGTLIRDATGPFMFDMVVRERFLKPVVWHRLDEMRKLLGLERRAGWADEDDLGTHADLIRIKEAFQRFLQAGRPAAEVALTTHAFYHMCSWIYAGHTVEEVEQLAARALQETPYGANFFDGARDMIKALGRFGIDTMVVSATFEPIVRVAAGQLGIQPGSVRGTRLRTNPDGLITDELSAPLPFREGKVAAARELMQHYYNEQAEFYSVPSRVLTTDRPALAMGDSPSKTDEQLLEFAAAAVIVEPQTAADLERAVRWANEGKSVLILDYEKTVAGEPADRYDVERAAGPVLAGSYL